jgi:DNA polymerase III delta prime subunit
MNTLIIGSTQDIRMDYISRIPNVYVFADTDTIDMETAIAFRTMVTTGLLLDYDAYYIGAHQWGIEAQQVLLKVCEEPPQGITIYLGAPSPQVLLPTLLSRLSPVRIDSIQSNTTAEILFEECDNYTLEQILEYVRATIDSTTPPKRRDAFMTVLETIKDGKVPEKYLKEALLLL